MYSGTGQNAFSQDRKLNSVALFKELVKNVPEGGSRSSPYKDPCLPEQVMQWIGPLVQFLSPSIHESRM